MFFKSSKKKYLLFFLPFVLFFLALPFHSAQASKNDLNALNLKIINTGANWIAGETSVSRLSPEELQKRLGLNKRALLPEELRLHTAPPMSQMAIPTSLDYRNYGYVTPIKDQGGCGSCWAFAIAATVESQILMKTSITTDLSEQTLISCGGGEVGSCNGGSFFEAANFSIYNGLPLETCFPYTATNNSCSNACSNWQENSYKISNWLSITDINMTVDAIKKGISYYGPLVAQMEVYEDFVYYVEGVYSHVFGKALGSHIVEIIGYDDTTQAFIAKNSWGTGWGEKGFFRIAYSQVVGPVGFGLYASALNVNDAMPCTYSISPESVSFDERGATGTIHVYTQPRCVWNVYKNPSVVSSWLIVGSTGSGVGNGEVAYFVNSNSEGKNREGTIVVAGNNFIVSQSRSKNAECEATINENLLLHIPYIYYVNASSEKYSLWADLIYEFNPTYPTTMFYRLKDYSVINNTSSSCALSTLPASTLSADLKLHIPNILSFDGLNHIWADFEYSPDISTNGNTYFRLTNYGVASN